MIPTRPIEIIAAVSRNLVIGKNNSIPWNIKEDLQRFKKMTEGHVVVMGKRTFFSIKGAPLKNRYNIVVTSTPELFKENNACVFTTIEKLDEVLSQFNDTDKRIFIIGGKQLYSHFIYLADFLHLTHVDKIVEGDTYFPSFSIHQISDYEDKQYSKETNCNYQFITYKKSENVNAFNVLTYNDFTYSQFLNKVLLKGIKREDRTGTGTISVFGKQMHHDLKDSIPLLTTKNVPWKACIKELLWFLKGQTDASILQHQGVHIWDGNTTREFLDKRGLEHFPEGDIGCGYGFQWRHFGADYKTCKDTYDGQGFDQVQYVIDLLKNDPYSRRIFMSAWNPYHMSSMALPPCHVSAQFYVHDEGECKYLSCHMYQRSVDCFLGLPFNILSYATLTYILCNICNMKPHSLIISTGDTHIYNDHTEQVKEQLKRAPVTPAKLIIKRKIESIGELSIDDFDVVGYFHHNTIKAKMSV